MRGKRTMIVPGLVLGMIVAGCAAQQQSSAPPPRASAGSRAQLDQVDSQCRAELQQPALAPLRGKVDLRISGTFPNPALLADRSYPDAAQQQALLRMRAIVAECRERQLAITGPQPALAQTAADTDAAFARLHSREITFGQFNQQRAQAAQRGLNAMIEDADSRRVTRNAPMCQSATAGQNRRLECH